MRRSTMSSIDTGRPQRYIDAFLRRNGVTPATAENDGTYDGTYGRKIYGPVPDDIKALLKKIGLGASECGNTLGELFQKWGVQ